ncbi:hypothetical protein AB0K35_28040 [Micromonospora sp. NPDC053740]|uniref:hypothetical protein n=1 Tax=Micromonospora sp. NPDC053740 TaxID=3155173 RepID=UPI00343696BA
MGKDGQAATPARLCDGVPGDGGEAFIPRNDGQPPNAEAESPDAPADGGRTRRKTPSTPADAPADTSAPKE